MPSIGDVFEALQEANRHLTAISNKLTDTNNKLNDTNSKLDNANNKLDHANNNLQLLHGDLGAVIALETYTNQALYHNSQQNDTIICSLEDVARNLCRLLNEAHTQTGLQTSIEKSTGTLQQMYKTTHPGAGLELERLGALRKQIEECCPPETPEPICEHEPCEAPAPLEEPGDVEQEPRPPG